MSGNDLWHDQNNYKMTWGYGIISQTQKSLTFMIGDFSAVGVKVIILQNKKQQL